MTPMPTPGPDGREAGPALPHFAAGPRGLERVLEAELRDLGCGGLEVRPGGVAFTAPRRLGQAACLRLRSAVRVQELLAEGPVGSPDDLRDLADTIAWDALITPAMTFAVDAAVRDAALRHPGATALTVKDSLADRLRARTGRRPDVDKEDPHLLVRVSVIRDRARIYRDLSGESLHKRGYRPVQVKSPLNEALAAGLVLLTGWEGGGVVADPMCGSGTFLIEAALIAAGIAPGLRRRFAFERWPDFDRADFDALRAEVLALRRSGPGAAFHGADRHAGAVAIARAAAQAAGVAPWITWEVAGAAAWRPPSPPVSVFTNPPYGERLGEGEDLVDSWRALGRFLHQQCRGAAAFVLCGNAELTRHLGLRASRRWPVQNGPIECRWLRYDVHPESPGTVP